MTSLALKDATLRTAEPDGDHLVQAAEDVNTCVGESGASHAQTCSRAELS